MRTHARAPGEQRRTAGARRVAKGLGRIGPQASRRALARQVLGGSRVQRQLRVGPAEDPLEREADAVASRVLAMPAAPSGRETLAPAAAAPGVQRVCGECEEEMQRAPRTERHRGVLRSKSQRGDLAASPGVEAGIRGLGSGRPLDPSSRAFFEPRFGRDFSGVRVHTDRRAAESARAVQARAFTWGRDIVFGEGEYEPSGGAGKRLLAHELTHVVQQSAASPRERLLQRASYGSDPAGIPDGRTGAEAGRLVPMDAADRSGANGADAALALIDRLIARADWRGRHCREFFDDHCSESLSDIHDRAVVWFYDTPRTGVWATSFLSGNDLGISRELMNVESRWATAASIIHEYIHLCGEGSHDIGDEAKGACGLPDI